MRKKVSLLKADNPKMGKNEITDGGDYENCSNSR